MQILNFISQKFVGIIFILGIACGIFWPETGAIFQPYVLYLLMAIFLLAFLKCDFALLLKEMISWKYQLYLLILNMLAIPVITFYAFQLMVAWHWIPEAFSIGNLLIFATATGSMVPVVALFLNGNFNRCVLAVTASAFLMPFSLPFLLHLFVPNAPNLNLSYLFIYLMEVILIPFVISVIVKKYYPAIQTKITPYVSPLTVFFFFFVYFADGDGMRIYFFQDLHLVYLALGISTAFFILVFILGWLLAIRPTYSDRMSSSMICSLPNVGMTVAIAAQFFQATFPLSVLYVAMGAITWCLVTNLLIWVAALKSRHS